MKKLQRKLGVTAQNNFIVFIFKLELPRVELDNKLICKVTPGKEKHNK